MPKAEQKNTRETNQRQLILGFLKSNHKLHPTAEQIYQEVRKALPQISLATVYRNLKILEEQGRIFALNYCKQYCRYQAAIDNHSHFICQKCDKVIDIELTELIDVNNQIAKRHEVKVTDHKLYFFGFCQDCLKVS